MKSEILHVLSYYGLFEYAPTFHEIFVSLRVKTSKVRLEQSLTELVQQKTIASDGRRYAKSEQIISLCKAKRVYSGDLKKKYGDIHWIFSLFPTILLIGISGSLSMDDAEEGDDIDLFVITKAGTLWLSRFYVLLITRLMAVFGSSTARKLCWNIFMEEQNLILPSGKQNEYTAHELVQLHVIFDRSNLTENLFIQNRWILKILPNVQINSVDITDNYRLSYKSKYIKLIDNLFRYFQLNWLKKKGYAAVEYPSQVWFIQNDFESRIPISLKRV